METTSEPDQLSYGTTISLRIWHPSIASAEMTNAIGLIPSLSNEVGTPRQTPTGQVLNGVYLQTYWLHRFEYPKSAEIEDCIKNALSVLLTKRDFLNRVGSTGGRCELFIGVFLAKNAGIELDRALVQQVADAGLGLSFDVFVPDACGLR